MSAIRIQNISRRFGSYLALAGVELEVAQGEFFSLLGPSGCGKTTLLNIIAGFLDPDGGRLMIGSDDITTLPAHQRNIGMVFQNYALFPHLSVTENVAYGLKIRKLPAAEIRARVREVLELVRLGEHAERMPHQLSGGQQQRVAIARALAIQPRVLLLDEPLSNLDAKLRKDMQSELRTLQKRIGITTILVTHDQEEALSLSDRIGVLGQGVLQQVGSPHELYRHPANRFVAEFIGQANLIEVAGGSRAGLHTALSLKTGADQPLILESAEAAGAPLLMLRPEHISVSPAEAQSPEAVNHARVALRDIGYTGASIRLAGELEGGGLLVAHVPETAFAQLPEIGAKLDYRWRAENLVGLVDDIRTAAQTP